MKIRPQMSVKQHGSATIMLSTDDLLYKYKNKKDPRAMQKHRSLAYKPTKISYHIEFPNSHQPSNTLQIFCVFFLQKLE